jgi:hypothetical protein
MVLDGKDQRMTEQIAYFLGAKKVSRYGGAGRRAPRLSSDVSTLGIVSASTGMVKGRVGLSDQEQCSGREQCAVVVVDLVRAA